MSSVAVHLIWLAGAVATYPRVVRRLNDEAGMDDNIQWALIGLLGLMLGALWPLLLLLLAVGRVTRWAFDR